MNGLQRYDELKAAVAVIAVAKRKLLTDGDRVAWTKAFRVEMYLEKQQKNVMEGLTEDGAEDETVALAKLAEAQTCGELLEAICPTMGRRVWATVEPMEVAPAGWGSVEGGAL